jgi:hypothetical protein
LYPCPQSKITPPAFDDDGRLFGCIAGKGQTAKYFINETHSGSKVLNIKIIWNDWFQDVGYGLHADAGEAVAMVNVLAGLYAPADKPQLIEAFSSSVPKTIKSGGYEFRYTYRRGPKIDERVIVMQRGR